MNLANIRILTNGRSSDSTIYDRPADEVSIGEVEG